MAQKIVLLSCIGKHKEHEAGFQSAMFDSLTMYINPALYKYKRDKSAETPDSGWERVNMDFANQSRTAAVFGKPELAEPLAKALEKIRNEQQQQQQQQQQPVAQHEVVASDNDEVLG